MNKLSTLFTLISLLISGSLISQSLVFQESFEMPSGADSVTSSGNPGWALSSNYHYNGSYCDTSYVAVGDTCYLTTSSFSTNGNYFVLLEFAHICKIEFNDFAILEVSTDNGASWVQITGSQYLGSGQFGSQGNKFSSVSYVADWQPTNNNAIPDSSWWKVEQFDLSSLASNASQVKVRFVLYDGNLNGSGYNYGWLIDDIKVSVAYSELLPPTITLNQAVIDDTVFNTGPFNVSADIIDGTGIDTALLVYIVNGVNPDTLGLLNTSGDTYVADIPSYTYGNVICYHIVATDLSPAANVGVYPASGCDSFLIMQGPSVVQIGTSTSYTYYIPFYGYYDYAWSSFMYKSDEINKGGIIDSISLYVDNTISPYSMGNQKIYMGHYTSASFPNGDQPDPSTMTLVFDDSITWTGPGWKKISLQYPFGYNGTDHLIIYYENRDGSGLSGYPRFRYTSTSPDQQTKYRYQSGSFPTTTGYLSYYRPNIRIAFNISNYPYDAGVSQIIQPQAGVVLSGTSLPVEVLVKNYGTDTLTKATVGWSVDDSLKGNVTWTGSLLQDVNSSSVLVGSDSLSVGPHIIKVWTSMPNDSVDQNNFNDTASVSIYSCSNILNGVYTIGGANPDFVSFEDALQNLSICGLSGPVTFNVSPGTYTSQLEIPDITGTSDTNTITFQSATGDYNDVIITFDSVDYSNNYLLYLDNAKHYRFKNLSFITTDPDYSRIIQYNGLTRDNRFVGNYFKGVTGTSTSTNNCLVYSASGSSNVDTMSVYDGNIFEGGSYAMYIYGGSTYYEDSTQIINNQFINQYSRGIQMYYQEGPIISGNTFTSSNYSLYYGIYAYYCTNNMRITNNRIYLNNGPNQAYGLYLYNSSGTLGNEVLIANNMIVIGSTYSAIGVYIYNCNYQHIYHNSIDMIVSDIDWNVRTLNLQGTIANLDIKNNIFANSGGGLTIVGFISSGITSDYNVLHTTGNYIAAWGSPTAYVQQTLSAYQNASNQDNNSVATNPGFFASDNLHTQSPSINNMCLPVLGVIDDIDGESRSSSTPDPGADEYSIYPYDAGITGITAPGAASCGLSSAEDVTVAIKNYGSNSISNFSVSYIADGGSVVTETYSGSISPYSTSSYTFATKANLSAPGDHSITAFTGHSSDGYHPNDSLFDYKVVNSHDFSNGSYTMSFEADEDMNGWTIQDINNDNSTWEMLYNNPTYSQNGFNCARFLSDSLYNGNDWLFSRCFYLQSGTAYKITFSYRVMASSFPHSVELKLGSAQSPSSMTTSLIDLPSANNTTYQDISTVFMVPSSGTCYFGWKAYSDSTNSGTIYDFFMDDVNIEVAPGYDAEMLNLTGPTGGCGLGSETISVQIRNLGNSTISGNFTAHYRLMGSSSVVSENITSSISAGDTLNYNFSTLANLSVSGSDSVYEISCWVNLSGDTDNSNDSLSETIISKYQPADPLVSNTSVTFGNSTVLTVISQDSCYWYDVPTGGTEIASGLSFSTPNLYDTATYYVESRAGTAQLKITEIAQYAGYGAGGTSPMPNWITGDDLIEITNLGSATLPLNNYQVYVYTTYSSYYYNLPTVALGSGEIMVLNIGSGTDDPAHNYYNMSLGTSLGSSTQAGFVIRDGNGNVVDVVATNSYSFPTNSGITQNDWNGGISSSSGKAGVIRVFSDNNDASDWVVSDNPAPLQTFGSLNPQLAVGTAGVGCSSNRVPVYVYVTGIPQNDAGVLQIKAPLSGTNMGSSENVEVQIKNFGTNAISYFPVSYILDGSAAVTETINSTIAAGDSLDYTFSATCNLSNYTTYSLKAFTSLNNDAMAADDTAAAAIANSPLDYCISKATSIDHMDIGRVRVLNLFENGNENPQYNNPNAYQTYTDYTNIPASHFKPGSSYTMFVYKTHPSSTSAACYVNVFIDLNGDGDFDMATERMAGDDITSTQLLTIVSFVIPSNTPSVNTRMRIVMKENGTQTNTLPCGTYDYGETEDYTIIIAPKIPFDAGIVEILEPENIVDEGSSTPIQVVVKNYGTSTITSMDLAYSINGGSPVTQVYSDTLDPDESDTIQLSNFIVPPGWTNILAYTDLIGDYNTVNDSKYKQVFGTVTVNLPYSDDFEGNNIWFPIDTIGYDQWERGTPDGDFVDMAHSPIMTWGIDLDDTYYDNSEDYLYTPKFNFGPITTATMSFWHFVDTKTEDGGLIEYTNNNGLSWLPLGTLNDSLGTNWYNASNAAGTYYWSAENNGWMKSTYDLSGFANSPFPVQFRFKFISDATDNSDGWFIDDFCIDLPAVTKDATPVTLLEPSQPTAMGGSVTVSMRVLNQGTSAISSMNLGYTVNGANPVTETWTGTLASGATLDYTFSNTYTSPISDYSLCVFTALSGDAYTFNDTLCDVVHIVAAAKDAGVYAFVNPGTTTNIGNAIHVKVTLKNYGTDPITSMDVSYKYGNNAPVTETWTGYLTQNATEDHTFGIPYYSPVGIYDLCAFTDLTGDPNSINDEICMNIEGMVGIDEVSNEMGFYVVPNPADDKVIIEFNLPDGTDALLEIINMMGQKVYAEELNHISSEKRTELNVKRWEQGIYTIHVFTTNKRYSRKLVIHH